MVSIYEQPSFLNVGDGRLGGVLSLSLVSCDTPVGQGAGIGAASGAIIGGLATNRVAGAAAGAAIGAAAGAWSARPSSSPTPRHMALGRRRLSRAHATDRKGFVISPYAPYHEIDVQGDPRGALVRDPSCNRLFVNP